VKLIDLQQIDKLLRKRLKGFATKDDLRGFATKDDLRDALKNHPTKKDLKNALEDLLADVIKVVDKTKADKKDVDKIEGQLSF